MTCDESGKFEFYDDEYELETGYEYSITISVIASDYETASEEFTLS